ncbi:hypothetical protein FIM12_01750 [SAR202 cluster bacterium AD-804-J14_MRT_500m]|nr:hypothetical protein [SAR202 cluster bacterium AD-804-J14_MRT_500m]
MLSQIASFQVSKRLGSPDYEKILSALRDLRLKIRNLDNQTVSTVPKELDGETKAYFKNLEDLRLERSKYLEGSQTHETGLISKLVDRLEKHSPVEGDNWSKAWGPDADRARDYMLSDQFTVVDQRMIKVSYNSSVSQETMGTIFDLSQPAIHNHIQKIQTRTEEFIAYQKLGQLVDVEGFKTISSKQSGPRHHPGFNHHTQKVMNARFPDNKHHRDSPTIQRGTRAQGMIVEGWNWQLRVTVIVEPMSVATRLRFNLASAYFAQQLIRAARFSLEPESTCQDVVAVYRRGAPIRFYTKEDAQNLSDRINSSSIIDDDARNMPLDTTTEPEPSWSLHQIIARLETTSTQNLPSLSKIQQAHKEVGKDS